MNELYIPGDLVMTNGLYGGTAKDVIYKVASSDPLHIHVLSDGTVLKGLYRLKNLEGAKIEDKGYLRYGCCYINFKDIVPVPLTTEILEKNGWAYYAHCDKERIYLKDYKGELLYIGVYEDDGEYIVNVYNGINDYNCASDYYLRSIKYVHQLQHLLFGLELKLEVNI